MKKKNRTPFTLYLILATFCSIPLIVIYSIYLNFKEGSGSSMFWGVVGVLIVVLFVSNFFSKSRLGTTIMKSVVLILLLVGVLFYLLATLGILIIPFSDKDVSVDLGILVIKSWVVKTLILILEGALLYYAFNWIRNSVKKLSKKKVGQ
jgi:hypothetical protein